VNLAEIEKLFENGEIVNATALFKKGLIKGNKNTVKVLGRGELKKKIVFEDCLISKSAEEKIKKAGGEIKSLIVK
jgi:large subunit ribosomal protein L15